MLSVKIEQPANHTTEDGRWDYRVTIRFKNSTVATTANPDEERLIKQLWPGPGNSINARNNGASRSYWATGISR